MKTMNYQLTDSTESTSSIKFTTGGKSTGLSRENQLLLAKSMAKLVVRSMVTKQANRPLGRIVVELRKINDRVYGMERGG